MLVRVDTKVGVHALSDPHVRQAVRRITQGSAPTAIGSKPSSVLSHPESLSGNGAAMEAFAAGRSPSFSPMAFRDGGNSRGGPCVVGDPENDGV